MLAPRCKKMVEKKRERIKEETSLSGDQTPVKERPTAMEESECKEESGASPCGERGWLPESVDAHGEGDQSTSHDVPRVEEQPSSQDVSRVEGRHPAPDLGHEEASATLVAPDAKASTRRTVVVKRVRTRAVSIFVNIEIDNHVFIL